MPSARDTCAPSRRPLRGLAVAAALACASVLPAVLPGATAAADEQRAGTTVVGRLVQVWAEGAPDAPEHAEHAEQAEHGDEGPLSFVETPAGDAVRVPTEEVGDLPPGATVSVTVGAEVPDGAGAADGVEAARTVLDSAVLTEEPEPATPAVGSSHEVTVVLVAPEGAAPDGTTVAEVVDVVDGPVAEFWAEQSSGAITLGVTAAHDWTATENGCSDPTRLWNEAAAAVQFVAGPRKHLLLYVTDAAPDCAYALAEIGQDLDSGGRSYVRDVLPSLVAHELGHNFGLGHSSARQCDAAVETGECRTSAYRDYYDVMGVSWQRMGSLNVAQAARLGVLPAAAVRSLAAREAGASVTLAPLAGGTGIRAVRLTDADGVDYWLEYRAPVQRDRWLLDGNRYHLESGVLLRRAERTLPDTSLLLDATPGAASGWNTDLQAALPLGSAVPVSAGDFTVVVRSLSAAGAVVDVVPSSEPTVGPPAGPPLPDADGAPVRVLSGAAPVAPEPVQPEVVAGAPATIDLALPHVTSARSAPVAEAAASSPGTGPGLPLAGVVLGGVVLGGVLLLAVARLRARGTRTG